MSKNFKTFLKCILGTSTGVIVFKKEPDFIVMLPSLLERDFPGKHYKWTGEKLSELAQMRFGFGLFQKPSTLQKVGDHHGVCRENIRYLERKILRILRHPKRRKLFAVYQQ